MTYNTEQLSLQPTKPPHGFLQQLLTKGKVFPFTKANDTIALSLARETMPTQVKETERNEKPSFWTEESLESESLSGWSQLYFLIVGLAKILLILFLPLAYLVLLFALSFGQGEWAERWEVWSIVAYGLTLYFTLPCLLAYMGALQVGM